MRPIEERELNAEAMKSLNTFRIELRASRSVSLGNAPESPERKASKDRNRQRRPTVSGSEVQLCSNDYTHVTISELQSVRQ